MTRHIAVLTAGLLLFATAAFAQNLDGRPFDPATDPDPDMYMHSWMDSDPRTTYGAMVEQDVLTQGDPVNPPEKGAVLKYTNRFTHAMIPPNETSGSIELDGEQYVLYVLGGEGELKSGIFKKDSLFRGIAALVPDGKTITITNTGDEPLTMYLISEPVPQDFEQIGSVLIKNENTTPIRSSNGHWAHIVKSIFVKEEGLATLYSVFIVSHDPMTIGHPHSHDPGCEEVWTAVSGASMAFIGKQVRMQPPGTAYNIPPNGNTPHCNINTSDRQVKHLYFSVRKDLEDTGI